MEHPISHIESPEEAQEKTLGRRKLLKVLAASGGAIAASTLLPDKWAKPVVEVGALPAHAQVSPLSGDIDVVFEWVNETNADFDLHVVDPADGVDVFDGGTSTTLTHDGDTGMPNSGSERVSNTTPGVVVAGTYQIYVNYVDSWGLGGETLTATVTVNGTPHVFDLTGAFGDPPPEARRVADVTFPGGTVADRAGQPYP